MEIWNVEASFKCLINNRNFKEFITGVKVNAIMERYRMKNFSASLLVSFTSRFFFKAGLCVITCASLRCLFMNLY